MYFWWDESGNFENESCQWQPWSVSWELVNCWNIITNCLKWEGWKPKHSWTRIERIITHLERRVHCDNLLERDGHIKTVAKQNHCSPSELWTLSSKLLYETKLLFSYTKTDIFLYLMERSFSCSFQEEVVVLACRRLKISDRQVSNFKQPKQETQTVRYVATISWWFIVG